MDENHPNSRRISSPVEPAAGGAPQGAGKPVFSGCFTALITPFRAGKLDDKAFQNLVDWQVSEGINGLVPCGTTGESPTLSHKERMRVTELCVEVAARRVPVIAGTGSNSTQETVDFARHAEKAGADAQLVVTPYYNKPTPEGLYQHFKAVHDHCGLPIIIYNIPGRSVVDMSVETMVELAKLPRIIGVKDATGDLARPLHTRLAIGPHFSLLSGDDATALAFLAQGGHGVVSVTSNIAPKSVPRCKRPGDPAQSGRRSASMTSWRRSIGRFPGNQPCSGQVRRQPSGFVHRGGALALMRDQKRQPEQGT